MVSNNVGRVCSEPLKRRDEFLWKHLKDLGCEVILFSEILPWGEGFGFMNLCGSLHVHSECMWSGCGVLNQKFVMVLEKLVCDSRLRVWLKAWGSKGC